MGLYMPVRNSCHSDNYSYHDEYFSSKLLSSESDSSCLSNWKTASSPSGFSSLPPDCHRCHGLNYPRRTSSGHGEWASFEAWISHMQVILQNGNSPIDCIICCTPVCPRNLEMPPFLASVLPMFLDTIFFNKGYGKRRFWNGDLYDIPL